MDSQKNTIKILAFRFNALGDVAMTIPVLQSITRENPNIEITLVSRPFAKPLVDGISGVNYFPIDLNQKHKGILGLFRLFFALKKENWNGVADLHDVLRTKILRILFRIICVKVAVIDKGRKEKRALTRKKNKQFRQLKHTVIRYQDVFNKLGISNNVLNSSPLPKNASLSAQTISITGTKNSSWIGVAPFAKHKGKTFPFEKMLAVIEKLSVNKNCRIFLFGGPGKEATTLDDASKSFSNVVNIAGKISLSEEMAIISNLDVMVSMDSANMHLASLFNVPVVSIWGATHRFAGFYGWNQSPDSIVETQLDCRPCSVFGNKPCYRKDYACMNIDSNEIVERVKKYLE